MGALPDFLRLFYRINKTKRKTHLVGNQNFLKNKHFLPPNTHTHHFKNLKGCGLLKAGYIPSSFLKAVCAYQRVRNGSFSEDFAYLLNEWPQMYLIFLYIFKKWKKIFKKNLMIHTTLHTILFTEQLKKSHKNFSKPSMTETFLLKIEVGRHVTSLQKALSWIFPRKFSLVLKIIFFRILPEGYL